MEFHIEAVREMCRIAKEIRIYPILDANANRSAHADLVNRTFNQGCRTVVEERVPYEFQRGGNVMMRIIKEEAN